MFPEQFHLPILADLYDEKVIHAFLQKTGFIDWRAAREILTRLDGRHHLRLAKIFSNLISAIASTADPDRALINFERLLDSSKQEVFSLLEKNPHIIEILVTLFSISPFLTEIVLNSPDELEHLDNHQVITERKTIEQYQSEALAATDTVNTFDEKLSSLRRYQRSQLLRIGTSDFMGFFDLRTVFSQLSRMAVGLVRTCLFLASQHSGVQTNNFVILAMGKLGGWELNYSSDIDLVFVAKRTADEYNQLTEQLIKALSSSTAEGFLYRVDLRLRPWGKDGPLVIDPESYLRYYMNDARFWEKQAFLKARPIAGNLSFGEEIRAKIEPFLFCDPSEDVRKSILNMKQRTEEELYEKGSSWGEVKLGEGSIRDIEFVVQFLQITHPFVRTRATLKAIHLLHEEGFLTSNEAFILKDGYTFHRTLEHYLQMIDYRQTHRLPSEPNALALLARRLGFEGQNAGGQFVERYEKHCKAIRAIFMKYVGNESLEIPISFPQLNTLVQQHITQMDKSYISSFNSEEIEHHTELVTLQSNKKYVMVDTLQLDSTKCKVTIVANDYMGELAVICGLFFVYGLDIIDSKIFTYEPIGDQPKSEDIPRLRDNTRRKIVDVFTVRSTRTDSLTFDFWNSFTVDLESLIRKLQTGQRQEVQGELAKRVGETYQELSGNISHLYPIEIEINNDISSLYTVLQIGSIDTVGFLYEFCNALAMAGVNVARMFVESVGERVNDTIFVTDHEGKKITSPQKQQELRAAVLLIKHFTHLLPRAPNPKAALIHFGELLLQLFENPKWSDDLANLEQPEVLNALAKLLGMSDFLWEDFLRMQHSNLFPIIKDVEALAINKDISTLRKELNIIISHSNDWRNALNVFKDHEMFRIDMRHILGYSPEFSDFSYALTDLAEVVISAAYRKCNMELSKKYGIPYSEDGKPCQSTFFALGKCGGRELGFASDIELMLIYAGNGQTTGPSIKSNSVYFEELIQTFIGSIQARQEGIFQIDLQLRPYGKAGALAVSLDAFNQYFAPQGPAWAYERQALVKLRPICGDTQLGEIVGKLRDDFIYCGEPFNVTAMRAMREKQIRHLVTAGTFNAKYSPGGLVDLEYLVQGLQIEFGANYFTIRNPNIRLAMAALANEGLISANDYTRMHKAHTFLSWLIESMRVVRGNSKEVTIPQPDSEEFLFLSRRLRYGSDKKRLYEDITRYSVDVQELNRRLLPAT
jgi:[glutamine synthetase] adenylyltransferase / [glutamine synthetase]-adenylyl-L-tyrosine phosphorylase